ncbi:MAG TPA: hypothetical protein VLE97_11135 [Gaiellaceae bacterium]|nr:hypothetical protein [Gaiellaceae bacterium]
MMQRVVIEFVVEVPNINVAGDVETRIEKEHHDRLCDVLQSVTGFKPMRAPGVAGLYVGSEPVTWNEAERDWVGPDDDDGDDDDDDK